MLRKQTESTTIERRQKMGREVQRIGLGIVKAPQKPRGTKQTPSQWFGKQLERFGRRLQHRTPSVALATVRSEVN